MINKYYVGATHIAKAIEDGKNAGSTHADLSDAINEAKRKVQNGEANTVIVVQIIRVVRRDHPPVIVEDVQ